MTDRDASSSRVTAILGRPIEFDSRVRVTGNLVLDCGHGLLHNCDEDDADTQNQEIHPVYAIDFVQNFQLPRPFAQLTGVWGADDAGTYYVRQIANTVWWLGLSVDEGRSFANVFRGTLQNGQISGEWSDVPLGQTANSGSLALNGSALLTTAWERASESGGFSGANWSKLYDVVERRVVVVFESAVANGAWPSTREPFELVVGNRRIEAIPRVRQSADAGNPATADLGVPIVIDASEAGPLRMAARYAGYRANWTVGQPLKPGAFVQSMAVPRNLPEVALQVNESEVGDRDVETFRRDRPAIALPGLTIRSTWRRLRCPNSKAPPLSWGNRRHSHETP
jgi:hypothetical protein